MLGNMSDTSEVKDPLSLLLEQERESDKIGVHGRSALVTIVRYTDDVADVRATDGRAGRMHATDLPPGRSWRAGERYMAVVVDGSATPVRVSANHPDLVRILLEGHSPEVRDGSVRVMAVARRPGVRTKISVAATTEGVDAVGAALGRAAGRVRAVSESLGGERIDVVAWNPDPCIHAVNALSVRALHAEDMGSHLRIVVPPYQMEAALGGGNMNLILAVKLVGRRIRVESA